MHGKGAALARGVTRAATTPSSLLPSFLQVLHAAGAVRSLLPALLMLCALPPRQRQAARSGPPADTGLAGAQQRLAGAEDASDARPPAKRPRCVAQAADTRAEPRCGLQATARSGGSGSGSTSSGASSGTSTHTGSSTDSASTSDDDSADCSSGASAQESDGEGAQRGVSGAPGAGLAARRHAGMRGEQRVQGGGCAALGALEQRSSARKLLNLLARVWLSDGGARPAGHASSPARDGDGDGSMPHGASGSVAGGAALLPLLPGRGELEEAVSVLQQVGRPCLARC